MAQFSHSVVSNCLQPHEPQHARSPCPPLIAGVQTNPCPLCQWCHPTISSSVVPFSSCLNPSQHQGLFKSVSSSHQVAKQTSVLPMNTQDWSPLGWTGWISLQSKGLFNSLLQHHSSKASILQHSALFTVQLSHPYMTTGRTIALTRQTFVDKVVSLLLNVLSRLVITFLPRSKCLLISWLQSPSAVILEPRKIKSATVSAVPPSICHLAKQLNNKFRESKTTSKLSPPLWSIHFNYFTHSFVNSFNKYLLNAVPLNNKLARRIPWIV